MRSRKSQTNATQSDNKDKVLFSTRDPKYDIATDDIARSPKKLNILISTYRHESWLMISSHSSIDWLTGSRRRFS